MNRLLAASLLSLAACGPTTGSTGSGASTGALDGTPPTNTSGAPTAGFQPTLTTLSGEIATSSLPMLPAQVRVALIWPTATDDGQAVAVDVALSATDGLPVRWVLDVTAPPPEAVMQRMPADEAAKDGFDPSKFRYAVGNVIAYVDANGNGKRDTDGASAEQIIALPSTVIYYVEGTPPGGIMASTGEVQAPLKAGFNILDFAYGVSNGIGGTTPNSARVTAIASDIDLELGPTSPPVGLLCATGFGASASVPPDSQAGTNEGSASFPAPGAAVFCSDDGEIFTWSLCSGSVCGETCEYGTNVLSSATPPANWPCTVKTF